MNKTALIAKIKDFCAKQHVTYIITISIGYYSGRPLYEVIVSGGDRDFMDRYVIFLEGFCTIETKPYIQDNGEIIVDISV